MKMVRAHGAVGNGFGSNLLTIYELAAAIEDPNPVLFFEHKAFSKK